MPMFDSIRDLWSRGVRDPLQFVDSVTPGNWRQNGEFDNAGIAAGVGQLATGLPAALTQPLISGMLRGDYSASPSVPRPNAIRDNRAAGVPRIESVIPQNEQGRAARSEVNPRIGMGESGGNRGPSLGGNAYTARGGAGGTVSSQRNIGAGQLGAGGDEAIAAHMRSLFNGPRSER